MKAIADLLFEARMLKDIPRSGYHFLGLGRESVAEHTFVITFIAFTMARIEEGLDAHKLISMCLVHDLPEARIGDMNSVQKLYVKTDEKAALTDMIDGIPFGKDILDLMDEFNRGETREARLAKDADQLSLILDLKALSDIGGKPPDRWLPPVIERLQTETGKRMADAIMNNNRDDWWMQTLIDKRQETK